MTHSGSQLLAFDREQRQAAVVGDGGYTALADALASELAPLLDRELPIPDVKARLTRGGGRCPVHGHLLEFDPFDGARHRCSRCDVFYTSREHHEWWAMGAQLYTAERAVHAAVLYALRGDVAHADLSSRILRELTDRYLTWPNQDNVLGPSRPFFSTYLESIWLLNICHALDLLETADAPDVRRLARHVKHGLISPSAQLIAGFDEGLSNRQVWNEVALLSAFTLLGDDATVTERLDSEEGLIRLMHDGLLDDGAWYEGENYHAFAHRGLWYGVQLMRARVARGDDDCVLPDDLAERYATGFISLFQGVLPDNTLPSRRDSQYGVSIRQWRFAEWCELAYAHEPSADVAAVLARLYKPLTTDEAPIRALSGVRTEAQRERACSTADAERNVAASPLSRASLSWRALLMAPIQPVPTVEAPRESVVAPLAGLAVIRRDGAYTYVALEGGHTGGHHGHPDRLGLTLQSGENRWLDDPGTGSYTDRSLHWYRSTLAHAAPLVDGASQRLLPATLLAFEDRGAAGIISKTVQDNAVGVRFTRTVVVCDGYVVDALQWESAVAHDITLPIAGDASVRDTFLADAAPAWRPSSVIAHGGLEDGFDALTGIESVNLMLGAPVSLDAHAVRAALDGRSDTNGSTDGAVADGASSRERARLWYVVAPAGQTACALYRASAPGAPGHARTMRHWITTRGTSGAIAGVWSWPTNDRPPVRDVAFQMPPVVSSVGSDATAATVTVTVDCADGTRAVHSQRDGQWHIELLAGGARSSIDFDMHAWEAAARNASDERRGAESHASDDEEESPPAPAFADYEIPLIDDDALEAAREGEDIDGTLLIPMGSAHYVGTELAWADAGEPVATLQLARTATSLIADVEVPHGAPVAPAAPTNAPLENVLDNERADVNASGLQWYIGRPDAGSWSAGGLIVPLVVGGLETARAEDAQPHDGLGVRSHALVAGGAWEASVSWRATPDGWAMRLQWPLDTLPVDEDGCIAFDLIINERPPQRERRRGQLVLSGGGGFGYLRGDRHDPRQALVIAVTPAAPTG